MYHDLYILLLKPHKAPNQQTASINCPRTEICIYLMSLESFFNISKTLWKYGLMYIVHTFEYSQTRSDFLCSGGFQSL